MSNLVQTKQNFDHAKVKFLHMNYERQFNPFTLDTHSDVVYWLRKNYSQIWSHYASNHPFTDLILTSCGAYPFANERLLTIIAKCVIWGFAIDDILLEKFETYEQAKSYVNNFMDILEKRDLEAAKSFCIFCQMLTEIVIQLDDFFMPGQKSRFNKYTRIYLEGIVEETQFRLTEKYQLINVTEYLNLRRVSVGSHVYQLLAEINIGANISPLIENNVACALRNEDAVANCFSIINDLYSYNKECDEGNMSTNLLMILQNTTNKCGADQAVEQAIQLVYKEKQVFDDTCLAMLQIEDKDNKMQVVNYVRALSIWIYMVVIFHFKASRYNKK